MYKNTIQENTKKGKQTSSNLVYLLVIPGMLYLARYISAPQASQAPQALSASAAPQVSAPQVASNAVQGAVLDTSSSTESLMSKPYPDTTSLS